MDFKVKDNSGRVILIVKDGKIAASRFLDMTDEIKDYIVSIFKEVSNRNSDEILAFLNFETEENTFCAWYYRKVKYEEKDLYAF